MDNIGTPTNTLIQMPAYISDNVLDLRALLLLTIEHRYYCVS